MDRREAILRVATLTGLSLSAPLLAGLLTSCDTNTKTQGTQTEKVTRVVSGKHKTMVEEIAERIIPATDTPGAKEAKVPEFILLTLADCYSMADQDRFFQGLDALDAQAKKTYNNSFLDLKREEQTSLLQAAEKTAKAEAIAQKEKEDAVKLEGKKNEPAQPGFFAMMKELTVLGYFSSEIGATQALSYVHVPGSYNGCTDLQPNQKTWAT